MKSITLITMLCVAGLLPVMANNLPKGKYCGNIWGNTLNVSLSSANLSNISASLFGERINCNDEWYNYSKQNIHFNSSSQDCLNQKLKSFGACPCPPKVLYESSQDSLIIENTPIGNITLKKCK